MLFPRWPDSVKRASAVAKIFTNGVDSPPSPSHPTPPAPARFRLFLLLLPRQLLRLVFHLQILSRSTATSKKGWSSSSVNVQPIFLQISISLMTAHSGPMSFIQPLRQLRPAISERVLYRRPPFLRPDFFWASFPKDCIPANSAAHCTSPSASVGGSPSIETIMQSNSSA